MSSSVRRLLRHAVLVPALLAVAACDSDPVSSRPAPTFTRMILTLAPTGGGLPRTVEITRASSAVSGPLTITSVGGTLTATFVNADGSSDQVLATYPQEYETRVAITSGAGAATFTRTGPNTFSVTRTAAGSATAHVSLFDLTKQSELAGADVALTIQ